MSHWLSNSAIIAAPLGILLFFLASTIFPAEAYVVLHLTTLLIAAIAISYSIIASLILLYRFVSRA